MDEKLYALDMDCAEWSEFIEKEYQEPKFRADQICQWIWKKRVCSAEDMTNLSKELREKLGAAVDFSFPRLASEQRSSDGTRKFLWKLRDGESVESVLMKQDDRLTACISTQVGCPLQCSFCATGLSGFVRNLSPGEIAGQVLAIEKHIGREINNVVYMGMGEPFLNTEAVLQSVRMLNGAKMRNLGIRHITISTSGVLPGMKELAASGLGVRLAVSLHAADGELRSALMPVNNSYPVEELRKTMQEYQEATGDRITIEYALFGGVNDGVERARELVRYLKGIHVFVNLIPYNAVDGRYEKPKPEDVLRFRSVLQTAGFECEIRAEQGADIDAACGQLRRKLIDGSSARLEAGAFDARMRQAPEERSGKARRTASGGGGKSGNAGRYGRKRTMEEEERPGASSGKRDTRRQDDIRRAEAAATDEKRRFGGRGAKTGGAAGEKHFRGDGVRSTDRDKAAGSGRRPGAEKPARGRTEAPEKAGAFSRFYKSADKRGKGTKKS